MSVGGSLDMICLQHDCQEISVSIWAQIYAGFHWVETDTSHSLQQSHRSIKSMTDAAIKEINSVSNLFRSRSGVGIASSNLVLQKSFADTLIGIINGIKVFGPGEGSQLMDALKDKPYGDVHTPRLCEHIDAKMQSCHRAPATGANSNVKQLLKHWWHYVTAKDWAVLVDPKQSWNLKMTTLVERGISVGCVDPDEQSLKWLLATLLLAHYPEIPTYQQIYNKLQDLKQSYAAERKSVPHEQLATFPEDPKELPASIFNAAYPDEADKPLKLVIQGINTVAENIPLRKNSKLLKGKSTGRAEVNAALAKGNLGNAYGEGHPPPQAHSAVSVPAPAKIEAEARERPPITAAPQDADEKSLLEEYHMKLQQLRRVKKESSTYAPVVVPGGILQPLQDGPLHVHHAQDGSVMLRPRPMASKEEPAAPAALPKEAGATVEKELTLQDLDPYTQAALKALQSRDQKKKDSVAEARRTTGTLKRPAAASPVDAPMDAQRAKALKTDPAKKAVQLEATKKAPKLNKTSSVKVEGVEVSKSKIMTSMPSRAPPDGGNPAPVLYKKGVIYTSWRSKRFRALTTRGDAYTECSKAWGSSKPSKAAWEGAVKSIDAAASKRGK